MVLFRNNRNLPTSRKSKFFFFFAVIILFFILINLAKSWQQSHQVKNEMTDLQNQIQTLEKDNSNLKELVTYLNSNAYIEEKARVDLGLKKAGEKVVVVNDLPTDEISEANKNEEQKNLSNSQKWWKYFFK
ncbi:MAG: septum formation initiator family protein [Patescibacteria group bacterium]